MCKYVTIMLTFAIIVSYITPFIIISVMVVVPCYIGVGEVVAVGEGDASGLMPGDRVVAAPGSDPLGTWYVLYL